MKSENLRKKSCLNKNRILIISKVPLNIASTRRREPQFVDCQKWHHTFRQITTPTYSLFSPEDFISPFLLSIGYFRQSSNNAAEKYILNSTEN